MASKEAIHHDEGKRQLVAPQGSIELNQALDPNQPVQSFLELKLLNVFHRKKFGNARI